MGPCLFTNGYNIIETPYGTATSIDDVDSLHRTIALSLIKKKGEIDGTELRFLRIILRLTQLQLGKLLGATEQTVSLWERTDSINPAADMMVRLLVAEKLNAHPQPSRIAAVANAVQSIKERIVAFEHKKTGVQFSKKKLIFCYSMNKMLCQRDFIKCNQV